MISKRRHSTHPESPSLPTARAREHASLQLRRSPGAHFVLLSAMRNVFKYDRMLLDRYILR